MSAQMITTILDRAARQCSVNIPSSWLTASGQSQTELREDFLIETADDILDRIDPPQPISVRYPVPADGSENYALPADFRRLQRDDMAVYETTIQRRRCLPVPSDGMWDHIKEIGYAGAERFYRLKGYEGAYTIDFFDAPGTGIEILVNYVSNSWLQDSGGTAKQEFTDAEDVCRLPWRLVVAGLVWRFRERRGLPYQDKYNDYEAQLARYSNTMGNNVGPINFGSNTYPNSPTLIPVPDFIPES